MKKWRNISNGKKEEKKINDNDLDEDLGLAAEVEIEEEALVNDICQREIVGR